jgi:tRNA A37 threonylcarbamoyladenosine synthetase subunit TsaC/SUA5/YrdC
MKIINYSDFENEQDFYLQEALNEKIFIYPTDTIYGI